MNQRISTLQRLCIYGVVALATLVTVGQGFARAEVIQSLNFEVGIDDLGNLYDPVAGVGFRRISDGYDPIRPPKPRESFGVSAGALSGVVDPNNVPGEVGNFVKTGSAFGPNSGFVSVVFRDAADNDVLDITHNFVFVADNVLLISTQVSNLSTSDQDVLYSRNVNWDIAPSPGVETITASPLVPAVIEASFYGLEDPDPLVPFAFPTGAGGGFFGPGDLGAGLRIDLGTLDARDGDVIDRIHFGIFYAIGALNQTEAQLRTQLGFPDGTDRINTAAMGFVLGNPLEPSLLISGAAFVPEPSSVALSAIASLAMLGFAFGSKAKRLIVVKSAAGR